ncbi:protein serine/threonine phosphatase [Desulfatibacillum aliphaticivorans]|uniref:Protein serine/threonine phosphatase n=1 Tax=Desulfatibacillum aliphaticivorans TaxID=218208 RepID=B8F9G7_DESAL|nr:SpoIIE family protein phosphatase [Desulfatibacillum aliphaticivorans]ACL02913.1 protein serine/threonine phosphatase [Desulfatibacillum aliphaticivorans]
MRTLKLTIRWKYFTTLLALCLFPLLVITLASHAGITQIVGIISQDTRSAFKELSQRTLLQTAQTQALIFQRTRQAIELGLLELSKEAQLAELEQGGFPADMFQPMAALLANFPHSAKKVVLVSESGQSMSLEAGSVTTESLDAAAVGWFQEAMKNQRESGSVSWMEHDVYSDRNSSKYTALAVFKGTHGFKRIAALEIDALDKLNQGVTPAPWRETTLSFLVEFGTSASKGNPVLKILAQKSPGSDSWSGPRHGRWLASPDAKRMKSVLDSISRGGSGAGELPYMGQDYVWAWAPTQKGPCFVIMAPLSVVEARSQQVEETLHGYTRSTLILSGMAALATLLLVTLAAFVGARRFSRPLLEVIRGVTKVSRGDFSVRVDLKTGDEWDSLIQGFNRMVPMLEETMAWRKRLELAREVQQNLLPKRPPKVNGLDIAARSVSAQQVGGDYFDFLKANEEQRLTVAVGDITGHGVGAALLMTTARALVRRRSRRDGDLAQIVSDINKQLAPDVADSGKFMTLFLAEVDISKMVVRYANAGHDPAMVYDPTNKVFETLEGGGLILGPFESSVYEQYETGISPGHIITLGTDGIWETSNFEGKYYGKKNLQKVVADNAHLPAEQIVDKVLESLNAFRSPKVQEDDLTLVIIKILEQGAEYKQLKLPDMV